MRMNCLDRIRILTLGVLMCLVVQRNAAQRTQSDNTLDGQFLLRLGNKYDKPLFRLLGKTFKNLERKISNAPRGCEDWSTWSECSAEVQQFGMKVRTRRCILKATYSGQPINTKTETNSMLCEKRDGSDKNKIKPESTTRPIKKSTPKAYEDDFVCPYTVSKNGFCLKYFQGGATIADAKSNCRAHGGYVVNVNSPEKMIDVMKMPPSYHNVNLIWIDGERENVRSPWRFTYETHLTWSPEWAPGNPMNRANYTCLVINKNRAKMDYSPTSGVAYVCEIVRQINS